jgi:hypothetical protein
MLTLFFFPLFQPDPLPQSLLDRCSRKNQAAASAGSVLPFLLIRSTRAEARMQSRRQGSPSAARAELSGKGRSFPAVWRRSRSPLPLQHRRVEEDRHPPGSCASKAAPAAGSPPPPRDRQRRHVPPLIVRLIPILQSFGMAPLGPRGPSFTTKSQLLRLDYFPARNERSAFWKVSFASK